MSFTLIRGSFINFVELLILREYFSIFLNSPPHHYELVLGPPPAFIKPGEFYVEYSKIKEGAALKYTVIDLLGRRVEGYISAANVPALKGKITKTLKREDLEPVFFMLLEKAVEQRHVTTEYQRDPQKEYFEVIRRDMNRQLCLVDNPKELDYLINKCWLTELPQAGLDFVQGVPDARVFSDFLFGFNLAWRKFLLQGDVSYLQKEVKHNITLASFAYLMKMDQARPGKDPRRPAGFSLFCRNGAPNIFMFFHITNPAASIGEREVAVVIPTMLLPSEFRDNASLRAQTSLKFITFEGLQTFAWNDVIKNPKVSEIITLLMNDGGVFEPRLQLISAQNLVMCNPGFMRRDSKSQFSGFGSRYQNFQVLIAFLQELGRDDCHDSVAQNAAAIKILRSNREFASSVLGMTAFMSLGNDMPEDVVTLLPELCFNCNVLLGQAPVSPDRLDRALMILSVQYIGWHNIIDTPCIQVISENIGVILRSLKEALPWIVSVEDDDPVVVANTRQFPLKSSSLLLSPEILMRAIMYLRSKPTDIDELLKKLFAVIVRFSINYDGVKDYGLPEAFYQHYKAVISGSDDNAMRSLRLLITQYANWHAMMSDGEYNTKKIEPLISVLLEELKKSLPSLQVQEQEEGRFRLIARPRAISSVAFYGPGPAETELDPDALSLKDPASRLISRGFLRPGYTQSV